MKHSHDKDWGNYWQGRAAKSSGEALVGVGIEKSSELSNYWSRIFSALPKTTRIADFACGAGSALRHAHDAGLTELTGIDIAPDAIRVLKQAIPGVQGCVSPVHQTPFDNGSFDVIVSQFGFEYAGDYSNVLSTASEIIRLLVDGGRFEAIVHIKGGAIEQESQNSLASIKVVLGSQFIQRAQRMFEAVYAAEASATPEHQKRFMQSLVEMSQAEGRIIEWLKSSEAQGNEFTRFGLYLINSTREMFEHRGALQLMDCLSWLEKMEYEILAYRGRMESMIGAALTQEEAKGVMRLFNKQGFTAREPKPFSFDPAELPAAWMLSAGA